MENHEINHVNATTIPQSEGFSHSAKKLPAENTSTWFLKENVKEDFTANLINNDKNYNLTLLEKNIFNINTETQVLKEQIDDSNNNIAKFIIWITEIWTKIKDMFYQLLSITSTEVIKNLKDYINTELDKAKKLSLFIKNTREMYNDISIMNKIANILSVCSKLPDHTNIDHYLEFIASYLGVEKDEDFIENILNQFANRAKVIKEFIEQDPKIDFLAHMTRIANKDNTLNQSSVLAVINKMLQYPIKKDDKNLDTVLEKFKQIKTNDYVYNILVYDQQEQRLSGTNFYLESFSLLEKNLKAAEQCINSLTVDKLLINSKNNEPDVNPQQVEQLQSTYTQIILDTIFEATLQINARQHFTLLAQQIGSIESLSTIANQAFNAEIRVHALYLDKNYINSGIKCDLPKFRSDNHKSAQQQLDAYNTIINDLSNKMKKLSNNYQLLSNHKTFTRCVQNRNEMLTIIKQVPEQYINLFYSVADKQINTIIINAKSDEDLITKMQELTNTMQTVAQLINGIFTDSNQSIKIKNGQIKNGQAELIKTIFMQAVINKVGTIISAKHNNEAIFNIDALIKQLQVFEKNIKASTIFKSNTIANKVQQYIANMEKITAEILCVQSNEKSQTLTTLQQHLLQLFTDSINSAIEDPNVLDNINQELLNFNNALNQLKQQLSFFPENLGQELLLRLIETSFKDENIKASSQLTKYASALETITPIFKNIKKQINSGKNDSLSKFNNIIISGLASYTTVLVTSARTISLDQWKSEVNELQQSVNKINDDIKLLNELIDGNTWFSTSNLSDTTKSLVIAKIIKYMQAIMLNNDNIPVQVSRPEKYSEVLSLQVKLITQFVQKLKDIESYKTKFTPVQSAIEKILQEGITQNNLNKLNIIADKMQMIQQCEEYLLKVQQHDPNIQTGLLQENNKNWNQILTSSTNDGLDILTIEQLKKWNNLVEERYNLLEPYSKSMDNIKENFTTSLNQLDKLIQSLPINSKKEYAQKRKEIIEDRVNLLIVKTDKINALCEEIKKKSQN
jgi:hypothetical protein